MRLQLHQRAAAADPKVFRPASPQILQYVARNACQESRLVFRELRKGPHGQSTVRSGSRGPESVLRLHALVALDVGVEVAVRVSACCGERKFLNPSVFLLSTSRLFAYSQTLQTTIADRSLSGRIFSFPFHLLEFERIRKRIRKLDIRMQDSVDVERVKGRRPSSDMVQSCIRF